MGFNDFWINNNGKKEQLNNTKHGVRKEQVDKKFHNLFDAYDVNGDGTLENEELEGIFTGLTKFSGGDKVLDASENKQVSSLFENQVGIKDADFMGFVKSVSDASEEIVSSETSKGVDGGNVITTTYKNGMVETIYYYPDGEFKMKKLRQDVVNTQVSYTIGNDFSKKYTKKELDEIIKKEHSKAVTDYRKTQARATKENGIMAFKPLPLKDYTKMFMDNHVIPHTNTNEIHRRDEQYSPRYIAEAIGVNSNTEEGKKIIERFSQLSEEALKQLADAEEMKTLIDSNELAPTFDNISNVLELVYGITLRTEDELKEAEPQQEELITQIKAAEVLTNLYETFAQYNDQYTDNLGLFGLGSEGIGYVLNKLGIDGENHYQWADSCREFAQRASELKVLNPENFKEGFRKIYGENADKWGMDFNPDAFKKLFAIVDAGKATNEKGELTKEYKDAVLKACNFVADNPNDSTFNTIMNGFGEALVMIMTLGWGAEAKGGQVLASTAMGTFNKLGVSIASKQVNNKLLQGALRYSGKAVTLLGPALNEGTKMATYTLATGTASNIANRTIKFDSEENSWEKFLDTEAMVLDGTKGSFGFGAFAGVFGSTVTQAVVNRVSKTSSKVISSLSEKFAKGSVDATEVYAKVLEKSLPSTLAECAVFATDVIGFTGFEVALAIYNNADKNITAENFAELLWEEFKGQGYNLGQIKIISHLIMWMSGSRSARMNSEKYLKENIPQLKGATVEQNGESYKINLPDGRKIECKNENEMISSLHLMVRGQTAFSSRFDKSKLDTDQEPSILSRLENANSREDFVAIRDGILETKEKPQTSLEPRIKIEYKDGKTEKEILIEKVDNMIENILSRVDTSGYNTQKLKRIDLIEELIWDDVDLKLTPEEKELMKTIIIKQGHDSLTADKISDKHILYRFSDSFKEMTEPRNDISYLLRCLQNNNNLSDEQFNSSEVYQTYYKDNVFKKLTNKEINIITEILRNDKDSVDELIEHSKFDYSEIAKRDLVNLVKNKLGLEHSNSTDYYKEFLFCTREEFEAKIQRLNERPELIDNIKNFKFKTWQTLLNMPLEEYRRISTPIENREKVTLDTDNYRKKLKSELEKPQPYDIQEALEVSRNKDNLYFSIGEKTYKANKLIPFEPLESSKTEAGLETLPTTKDSMTQLEQNGKVQIEIKDKGGLNPTRAEEPVIHPEDISKLGQVESSEITVRYCAKTNWSNSKIARDIMQNFYDGNGHTLEGVNIDITQTSDGKYLIKISGEGHYDYERLDAIGNSSKDGDSSNAGGWGEGTRIVAGNLLSRLDTPYVKYACGDWEMKFGRSSDDTQTADMTQVLSKNNKRVKGNYIEFETADKELVQEILNSKDFFYQPYNKDFQNLDYENEFFGFKLLQNKDEKGNIYVVQRYETQDGIENSLDNLTLVFKKMPNDTELTEKNNGQELALGTGRDRIFLTESKIKELISRYLKTVPDKELMQTLATMKNSWIVGKQKTSNKMLLPLIEEVKSRGLGFEFQEQDVASENVLRALGLGSEKYMAVPAMTSPADTEMIRLMGYTPVIHELSGMGIPEFARPQDKSQKQPAVPTQRELQKLRLVSEAVSTIKDNLELKNYEHISDKEANAPTIICDKASSPNEAAEAILNSEGLKGEWMTRAHLECERFTTLLSTKLHEITHKYGGDLSESFSDALVDLQASIMKGFVHNPESLEKLRILEEVFNEVDGKSVVENYMIDGRFNASDFKKDIEKILSKPLDYIEYKEEENNGNSKDIMLRFYSDEGISLGSLIPKKTSLRTKIANLFKSNKSDNDTELLTSSAKKYRFENFEKSEQVPLERTLPSTTEALATLNNAGVVEISIPDKGGMNPTKSENPIIHTEDISNLDKTQKSKIMIRYCAKTNWSEFKVARDIMQNFYDGNGHTLEGVDIKIEKETDGTYKVRISGDGLYDYSHLKKIGDSTKDDDFSNAGGLGEGTRIVAGNLLSHLDTPYVKYACGDWEMNFGRSSDDIQTARMTQTLHKNSSPLKGNYIEFKTGNEKLIQEIINSKDFFYHPENSDFHNMLYENEFFGIKVLENSDEHGNFYLVQKYETENPDKDMKGISIVLKKSDKDPGIKAAQNRHLMIRRASVETGRDRVAISNSQAKELGCTYGMTMNKQDLVHTISSLKDFYILNVGSMLGKEIENGAILNNTEMNFICGLVSAASAKHIQIDMKDLKLATVSEYDLKYSQELVSDLLSKGYQFVPDEFNKIGIPNVGLAYKNEHKIKSLEPTKIESQKLQLLNEAIQLFAKNDNQGTIPNITSGKLYIFDASAQKHENIHSVVNGKQLSGLFVDKQYLRDAEFLDCVTRMIASSLHVHGDSQSANYSYELTDLITSEVNTLMHKPEIAQKLQLLKEKYDSLK